MLCQTLLSYPNLEILGVDFEIRRFGRFELVVGVAIRTYQRIQLVINRALPCLIAIPRMITRAIYTICVLLLRLIVERAITYRGGERIWIVFQPREDATAVFGCILDEFAVRAETADFVGG